MIGGINRGDVLQKIAGVALIVGAILAAAGFVIHPQIEDPTDMDEYIRVVADTMGGRWEASHFLVAVGFWALLIGFAGVYRSISNGGAAAWARLGFYGVIVSTTLWTLHNVFELGFPLLVEEWTEATGDRKTTLFLIASSLRQVDLALPTMFGVVNGLALIFVGIGMAFSDVYPRWLSAILIVLGAAVAVIGAVLLFTEITQALLFVFIILIFVTLLWALVTGAWITRKAW
jgi:hypothetical protein